MERNEKDVDELVVNFSSYPLTADQRSVLAMGLSHCPTPGEPDKGELREDLNRFHRDCYVCSKSAPVTWDTFVRRVLS